MPKAFCRPASALLPCLPACLLICLAALALSGCFAAQNYTVQCRIESDGSYRFFAEGLAVHTPTAFALRKQKHVGAGKEAGKDAHKEGGGKPGQEGPEAGLNKQIAECLKDKRVQYMQAAGEGKVRFAVSLPGTLAGTDLIRRELMSPLSLSRHPDGSVTVRIKDVEPSQDARALRIKPEGDIAVFVAEGVQVLAHNAAKTPTGPRGAYRWHITSLDDPIPYMTLRLPGTEPPAKEAPAPEKEEPKKDAKGKSTRKGHK